MEIHQAPHVKVDIIHLNSVSDFLLVKLSAPRENINVFIVEDTACGGITSHIQIRDSAPSVILDIVFLACCVERFSVIATDNKNQSSL